MPRADHKLGFSTFLKLLELPEPKKASMLRGFKKAGGYDYWKPLKTYASDVANQDIVGAGISDAVRMMSKGHQLKYNDQALTRVSKWFQSRHATVVKRPDGIVRKFTNSGLHVRLEPEVAFKIGRQKFLMHIWATNSPSLSERTLSTGLYYFKEHFSEAGNDDCQYLIYDTVKDRVFGELDILVSAHNILHVQREIIHQLWHDVWREGDNGGDDTYISPDDRPGFH